MQQSIRIKEDDNSDLRESFFANWWGDLASPRELAAARQRRCGTSAVWGSARELVCAL